jgi:hypothetical protein
MMGALVAGAIVITVLWAFAVIVIHAWREWHHYYIGLGMFVLAWKAGWLWLAVGGLVLMTDDAIQHTAQIANPAARSPLHLAYRKLIYEPWTRRHS